MPGTNKTKITRGKKEKRTWKKETQIVRKGNQEATQGSQKEIYPRNARVTRGRWTHQTQGWASHSRITIKRKTKKGKKSSKYQGNQRNQ